MNSKTTKIFSRTRFQLLDNLQSPRNAIQNCFGAEIIK
jgi:hypothetical protein